MAEKAADRSRDAARQARLAYLVVAALSRLGSDVLVVPDSETGELAPTPDFRAADLIVKHLDVRLRILLLVETSTEGDLKEPGNLEAAARIMRHWPDTTAVGLVANTSDLSCLILEPFDVEPTIAAPSGESLPPTPRRLPTPIDDAIRAYLNVVVPSWEGIPAGLASEPFPYAERARRLSEDIRREISSRRANIDEKRAAIDSLSDGDSKWVSQLIVRAVEGDLSADEIAHDIARRAGRK